MKTTTRRYFVLSTLLTALLLFSAGLLGTVSLSVSAAEETAQETVDTSMLSAPVITKGQSVTIYAPRSTAGTARYAYYVKKSTSEKWSTVKGFSSAVWVTYTPSAAVNYDVKVIVKNADGTKQEYVNSLKVAPALVNNSTVSKTEIALGNTVTIKGAAKGGSAPYIYAYYYKKADSSAWVTLKKGSTARSVSFKPTDAVDYELMVKVMDDNGALTAKTMTLKVYPKLVNQSSVTPLEVEKGAKVQFIGGATGGSGTGYQYSYSYKNSNATSWTLLKTYAPVPSVYCTMNQPGKVSILIKVKDSIGTVSSKTFTVNVIEQSANSKADAILAQIITPNMTQFDKVKAIHDWMVKNVSYDGNAYTEVGAAATSYTAEGLFDTHKAVCDGYSKAFMLLAQRAGLQANRVAGTATGAYGTQSHAWNQVVVDGKWYNIDVTWDDPIVSATYGDNLSYVYFLVPDSVINDSHFANSGKNSCTTAQPVEKLRQLLLAEEQQTCPNTLVYCDNETELANAVKKINGNVTNTTTFICRTELSNQEVFDIVKKNKPSTQVGYGIRMNAKGWKLDGYTYLNVILTVSQ